MRIKRWVHISELGSDPWVLPIWNSINSAIKDERIQRPNQTIFDLGLSLTTHLNMLPRLGVRIESNASQIYALIKNNLSEDFISEKDDEGYSIKVNDDLKYELLVDINAFIFELNIVWELKKKLLQFVSCHLGKPIKSDELTLQIKEVVGNSEWFSELDRLRNFLMHQGSPYIAVDVTDGTDKPSLIVMLKNVKVFDNPKHYIKLESLNKIVAGFDDSKKLLQNHLINLVDSAGK